MLKINSPEDKPENAMEIALMSKRNQVLRKWLQERINPKNEEDFQQVCLEMSRLAHQRRKSFTAHEHPSTTE
ncbi:hypothetical protein [Planctobacterium marinum]|uniref:Uncharacterized protein n=1 Tax=Planctobacterium marinum TaxID=1631968 RepID=A0AA48KPW8_9ALTE|nr:hypothetical protein MACH26_26320 [Planctobacterium marinum]